MKGFARKNAFEGSDSKAIWGTLSEFVRGPVKAPAFLFLS
jgi:hypothetical protein